MSQKISSETKERELNPSSRDFGKIMRAFNWDPLYEITTFNCLKFTWTFPSLALKFTNPSSRYFGEDKDD